MADNTTLNPGASGDSIRALARTTGASATSKTQVMALDLGGAATYAEVLLTAGATSHDKSLPAVLACIVPQTWDGTSFAALQYDAIEFQLTALTGTGPWTPQRSLDGGTTWDACQVRDAFNTFYSSLTSAQAGKCLSVKGRGNFRVYSATGGDTVTGKIRAS